MGTVIRILLFFFLLSSCGLGATYYVDATGGNDESADPTNILTPWKTISKINNSSFVAGDSILLKRGEIWFEQFLWTSTSAGAVIKIGSYDTGDKPVLHAGTEVTSWTDIGGGLYTKAYAGTPLWLLETPTASDNGSGSIVLPLASSAACADGNWYTDASTITYKPTNGTPTDHKIYRSTRPACFQFYSGTIGKITVENIIMIGEGFYNGSAVSLSNIIIQDVNFKHSRQGIYLRTSNAGGVINSGPITIQRCTFDYVGTNLYLISVNHGNWDTVTITNNIITYSNKTTQGGTWGYDSDRDGLSFQNLKNSLITRNEISGQCHSTTGGGGIVHWTSSGADATGNVIAYNYIHDIEGAGIVHGAGVTSTNAQIYYNIISNYGTSAYESPHGGIRINSAQTSGTLSTVYNNTIYNGDVGIYLNSLTDYYVIKNNIVSNCTYAARTNQANEGNNILSNNLYYHPTTLKFSVSGVDKTLAEWQAYMSPQDASPVITDPLFVSTSNFHLQVGSPAINAGVDVGLTLDYEGNSVPQGSGFDIGAYEFLIHGRIKGIHGKGFTIK